jgi:hypothetical protein
MTAVRAGSKRNNIDPVTALPQVIYQNPIINIAAGQRI